MCGPGPSFHQRGRATTQTVRLTPVCEIEHGFKEGDKVWVEDGDGKHHPGIFVAYNESSGWFGGGPSAYVVHPEAKQAEVVSTFRITPREG